MTVTATAIVPLIYVGTGTTDTYVYNFTIYQDSDLVVEEIVIATGVKTTLTLDAVTDGYTVEKDINGDYTGNIILSDGNLETTKKLVVYPDYTINQQTDYRSFGPLPSETHETGLDKLTLICQQLQEQIDRCVKSTIESGDTDPTADEILDDMNDTLTATVAAKTAAQTAQTAAETAETNAETAQSLAEAAQAAAEAAVAQINATIQDADGDTKIQCEESADEDIIRFDIMGIEQIILQDGAILPTTDNDIDLGSLTKEFKDLYLDGVAYVDSIAMPSTTITDILDEDNFASNSAAAVPTQQSTKAYVDGLTAVDDVTVERSGGNLQVKDASISTAKIKTSTGEVSTSSTVHLTLPGGEYGFYPQIKHASATNPAAYIGQPTGFPTSYATTIYLNGGGGTTYAQQRYLTASGLDHWVFLLVHKGTNKIEASYSAPDHPMYGNGGDIEKIPHPFIFTDLNNKEVVILTDTDITEIKSRAQSQRKSFLTILNEGFDEVDFSREEPYRPLHTGRFIKETVDGRDIFVAERITSRPNGIKVRRLKPKV